MERWLLRDGLCCVDWFGERCVIWCADLETDFPCLQRFTPIVQRSATFYNAACNVVQRYLQRSHRCTTDVQRSTQNDAIFIIARCTSVLEHCRRCTIVAGSVVERCRALYNGCATLHKWEVSLLDCCGLEKEIGQVTWKIVYNKTCIIKGHTIDCWSVVLCWSCTEMELIPLGRFLFQRICWKKRMLGLIPKRIASQNYNWKRKCHLWVFD